MQYQKPKGTKDIFGSEIQRIVAVCQQARAFFEQNGYQEIRTPTFEYADLFIRSIGQLTDIVEKENYTFEISNKIYMLRPEGTAAVLRAIIENKIALPCRFLYIEPMYRKEKPQKGRYREFLQIGIELIGEGSPVYDAEMIEQGTRFLTSVGAEHFTIELNSIGCPDCRADYKKHLLAHLQPKMNRLCDDCKRRMEKNFLRVFDCKNDACQKIYDEAPKITDELCADCAQHYTKVKRYLGMFNVVFTENKKLVRGLDYYTRTVFEFKQKSLGARDTILAGGRYDVLMKELGGSDSPALGWAMGVDCLLLTMPEGLPRIQKPKKYFLATMGESLFERSFDIRKHVQSHGNICIIGDPDESIKRQLKKANKLLVDYTIIFGEDEAKEKAVTVKDMKTGEQRKVAFDALKSVLAQ